MAQSTPPPSVHTVPDLVGIKAEEHGDKTYLQYKNRELSYESFHRKTDIIANRLLARGVEPGDHVCLFLYNSPEYMLSYIALAKLGAVVVPIDTRFTGETLTYVISKTEAETIFIDTDTRTDYEAVRDDLSTITTEYFAGPDDEGNSYRTFTELLDAEPEPPDVDVTEDETLAIIFVQPYASDMPKGVMLPHYAFLNAGWEMSQNRYNYSPDDTVFTTLPLHGILPIQAGAMGTLISGAEFVVGDPFDPEFFWEQVATYEATIVLYLGRMLSVIYNEAEGDRYNGNPLDKAIGHGFGFGSVSDDTLIRNFESRFGVTVFEGYGITETAAMGTFNAPEDRKIGTCGQPLTCAEVAIVDDRDRFVEPGESGEIVVRPTRQNTMFQGYYDNLEATVETCRNQWIHTGGIGYIDDDGFLHFVANEINAIYRGQTVGRISALEIESVINSHDGVETSAVVGVENDVGNEEIMAAVVPSEDADLDAVELCQHCELQLPHFKIPRYVEIRDDLPLNPSGKVNKNELRSGRRTSAWDRKSGYDLSR